MLETYDLKSIPCMLDSMHVAYPIIISAPKVIIMLCLLALKEQEHHWSVVPIFTDHLLMSFNYCPQLYLNLFHLSSIWLGRTWGV